MPNSSEIGSTNGVSNAPRMPATAIALHKMAYRSDIICRRASSAVTARRENPARAMSSDWRSPYDTATYYGRRGDDAADRSACCRYTLVAVPARVATDRLRAFRHRPAIIGAVGIVDRRRRARLERRPHLRLSGARPPLADRVRVQRIRGAAGLDVHRRSGPVPTLKQEITRATAQRTMLGQGTRPVGAPCGPARRYSLRWLCARLHRDRWPIGLDELFDGRSSLFFALLATLPRSCLRRWSVAYSAATSSSPAFEVARRRGCQPLYRSRLHSRRRAQHARILRAGAGAELSVGRGSRGPNGAIVRARWSAGFVARSDAQARCPGRDLVLRGVPAERRPRGRGGGIG